MLSSARSNCVSILAVRLKTHGAMIGSDSACFEDFDARSLDMTSKMSSSSSRTERRREIQRSLQTVPSQVQFSSWKRKKRIKKRNRPPFQFAGKPLGRASRRSKTDARPVLCTMQARPGRDGKQQVLSRQSLQVRVCSFPALLSRWCLVCSCPQVWLVRPDAGFEMAWTSR